jgi:hemoglobin-like flavoprotein
METSGTAPSGVDGASNEEREKVNTPRRFLVRKSSFNLTGNNIHLKSRINSDSHDGAHTLVASKSRSNSVEVEAASLSVVLDPVVLMTPFPTNSFHKQSDENLAFASTSMGSGFAMRGESELILDIQLLRDSFERIRPNALEFVKRFYGTLFAKHPPLHQLFSRFDQNHIEKKLVNILVMIVENIENEDLLSKSLSDLGRKHVGIGVIPPYFKLMGDALVETMGMYFRDIKSEVWTPATEESWNCAYSIVAGIMMDSMVASATGSRRRETASIGVERRLSSTGQERNLSKEIVPQINNADTDDFSSRSRNLRNRTRIINGQQDVARGKVSPRKLKLKSNTGSPFLAQRLLLLLEQYLDYELFQEYAQKAFDKFSEAPTWTVVAGIFFCYIVLMKILPDSEWINKLVHSIDEISLLVGVILYIKEAPDRRKQFHYNAWGAIDGAASAKVSQTRIMALQDLNNDGVSLRGFHGAGFDLSEVRLPGADLRQCQMSGTKLNDCNLSGADLSYATFTDASLVRSNLSRARLDFAALTHANCNGTSFERCLLFCVDLTGANLSGTDFRFASMKGACFENALLAGADFSGADVDVRALSRGVLSSTRMPDGTLSG